MPSLCVAGCALGGTSWKTSPLCCSYCARVAPGSGTIWGLSVRGWGARGWVPKYAALLGASAPFAGVLHHVFIREAMPPAAQTLSVPLLPLQLCWVTRSLAEWAPVCEQPGATAWLVAPWEGEHLARAERGLLEGSSLQDLRGEMMLFQAFRLSGLSSWV